MSQKTTSNVEDGLAELSGVSMCNAPGCYRMLKPGTGTQTPRGRVCFGAACVEWGRRVLQ